MIVKDVHKDPQLDLVGWYTTMPVDGPQQHHMPIQKDLSNFYPECSLLLGFHPSEVLDGTVGGKLPLTIWETNIEPLKAAGEDEMKDDAPGVKITYKEVPYTVETGEAEMISVDFVARGGGNATAIPTTTPKKEKTSSTTAKGKGRTAEKKTNACTATQSGLSRADEERIASLTAKVNAVKMLRARISLIKTYLEKLPPAYVSGETMKVTEEQPADYAPVDANILRSISALINRLALLVPSNTTAFNQELLAEQNDVNLVELLNTLTESVKGVRETGRKFHIVEQFKPKGKGNNGGDAGFYGSQGYSGAGDLMLN